MTAVLANVKLEPLLHQSITEGCFSIFIWFFVYRLLAITFFNGTIGMHILRVRFLNGDEQKLSFKEKILAGFSILFSGVSYFNK
jgi:uncharacterized RDD family membrane protein YckC